MGESKIQNGFSRAAFWTVGRLLAFVAGGFAIGLVVGVAAESPELLAGHLRGDSKTIELDGALAERVAASEADARARAARERVEGEAALRASEREALASASALNASSGSSGSNESDASDESIERDESDGRGALPNVAAPPPAGAPPGEPQERPDLLGASGGGRWAIQVGAFGDEPSANRLVDQLEAKGYPVEVLPAGSGSNRWRVRVQPIEGETAARATAERIEREERLPIWVIQLEGSTRE